MKLYKTQFNGLFLIKKINHKDNRGYLIENFKQNLFKNKLVFDNIVFSKKNVLRGLHFQKKNQQSKYISVIKGRILDVCLDLRKNSKTFGKVYSKVLSSKNNLSLFVPKGFAHGYYTFDDENIVYYKNSDYRKSLFEKGIKWNDTNLKINWPSDKPIISSRDKNNMSFKDFLKNFKSL